ncbi:anhydro-N-acetylmuramic acid kinase [Spiroplasma clarkii]|uniref:Anhydro-N-acetylmuramic acid kinase n=2 Tax=Spiroplasma clarkii TaxID=2139 RepID=A0A2K8KL32_9MOLU|nr:anhydro-N-acetylmuramic acid kinase [Spiroplasma clarkii]
MSGTSLDGIDGLLCDVTFENNNFKIKELDFVNIEYPKKLKEKLLKNINVLTSRVDEICELNFELANLATELVTIILQKSKLSSQQIDYIAMHGQTMYHIPPNNQFNQTPSTLQIADPCVVSTKTKIKVVNNFRSADIANGGQGAPLVPIADHFLFRDKNKLRIMVNIGGISNFSVLDPNLSYCFGYDVGPGNVLIDLIANQYLQLEFDPGGQNAAKGTLDEKVFKKIIEHDFFQQAAPKSTGRELFNLEFINQYFDLKSQKVVDILNTCTQVTAAVIATEALKFYNTKFQCELIICGGGAYNAFLVKQIEERLNNKFIVKTLEEIGFNAKSKECVAFAILGYLSINDIKINIKKTTGGIGAVVLGSISKNY